MVYEERVYKILPGRMPDIKKRFATVTMRLFDRHGITVVGFWQPLFGPTTNELCYICAFSDLNERERAWQSFISDPEWIQAKAESEKNGPLVADISVRILKPTEFSPLQ